MIHPPPRSRGVPRCLPLLFTFEFGDICRVNRSLIRACSIGNSRKPVYEFGFRFVVRLAKLETGFGNRTSAEYTVINGMSLLYSLNLLLRTLYLHEL